MNLTQDAEQLEGVQSLGPGAHSYGSAYHTAPNRRETIRTPRCEVRKGHSASLTKEEALDTQGLRTGRSLWQCLVLSTRVGRRNPGRLGTLQQRVCRQAPSACRT